MQPGNTLLKHLVPINQLQTEHRTLIAGQSQVVELAVGEGLAATEEHHWFIYLIKGKLALHETNKTVTSIDVTADRALHPIFNEKDHKARLIAGPGCVVARLDKQLFYTFVDQALISAEEVETLEMSEVEGNLFNEIMHAFNMGEIKLPSLPDIALNVKKL